MQAYATGEQLADYTGSPQPADAARLLARASELVNDHTVTAVYDTDTDGNPTGTVVVEAFRKATCAQVEFWLAGDEEDDVLGPLEAQPTGTGNQTYGSGTNRVTPMYLAPRAARHLRAAGLLDGGPVRSSW
jgi:hypothetical protein